VSTHVTAGYDEHNLRGTTVVGYRTIQPSLAEQIVLPRATHSDDGQMDAHVANVRLVLSAGPPSRSPELSPVHSNALC
jgi:hypothetical protein